MDKRSQRLTGSDAAERTDAPSSEGDWSALASTRVIRDLADGSKPTELRADETALPPATPAGREQAVLGDFRLIKKLGEGAMGAVYRARQLSFDRDVALKVLFKHVANNPKLVERLYREGRVMGQLDHPNIVGGYGIGEIHGWHYIAMEFIDGRSLQKWINRLERLSLGDALHIILACCRALQYAHGMGLVHRDIKPDNILITRTGQVKVADLGMVKTSEEDTISLTQTGHAVGTPWYMPLEQAKNAKDIDARSDIYALGCMLYAMLTGQPPFAGKTLVEVIQAKELGTFPPARSSNPDVPERLDLIIAKMANKLPKYRYQSCVEIIKDLETLGLASPTLTFLEAGDSSGEIVRPTPRAAATMAGPAADQAKAPDIWYVKFETVQGKELVRPMNTEQILKALDNKQFATTAMASRKPNDGFRALAALKEFQGAVLSRTSKDSFDQRTARFRGLYKKIEEQEKSRDKRDKPVSEIAAGAAGYWLTLAIKVAGGLAAVILVVMILYYLATGLGQ